MRSHHKIKTKHETAIVQIEHHLHFISLLTPSAQNSFPNQPNALWQSICRLFTDHLAAKQPVPYSRIADHLAAKQPVPYGQHNQ